MLASLALASAALLPQQVTYRIALTEGDPIPGGGTIAMLDDWSANGRGQVLAVVRSSNNVTRVILDDQLLLRQFQDFQPGVTFVDSRSVALDEDGHWASVADTSIGEALVVDGRVLVSTALPLSMVPLPGIPAGTECSDLVGPLAWSDSALALSALSRAPGEAEFSLRRLLFAVDPATGDVTLASATEAGEVVTSAGDRFELDLGTFVDANGAVSQKVFAWTPSGGLARLISIDGEVQLRDGDPSPIPGAPLFLGNFGDVVFGPGGRWAATVTSQSVNQPIAQHIYANGQLLLSQGDPSPDSNGGPITFISSPWLDAEGRALYTVRYLVPFPQFGSVTLCMRDNEVLFSSLDPTFPADQIGVFIPFGDGRMLAPDRRVVSLSTVTPTTMQRAVVLVELEPGVATTCQVTPNSTGEIGLLRGAGSSFLDGDGLVLTASRLPAQAFGSLIVSRSEGFVPMAGGSPGNLCLGSSLGRLIPPNPSSGATGTIESPLTLASLPQPTSTITAAVGETWFFQLWHRDASPAGATSNFTQAYRVLVK